MPVSVPKHSLLHPAGHIIVTPADGSREVTCDTIQCVHCQRIGIYKKGCGRNLGFCANCNGPTCDSPECNKNCVPFEKALDLYESQRILCLPGDLPRST